MSYRPDACNNPHGCGRLRVLLEGVCEKCYWDNDAGDWAAISRPDAWEVGGRRHPEPPDNPVL